MSNKSYLRAEDFYWYVKQRGKTPSLDEVYCFTSDYFTNGLYIKPADSAYHRHGAEDKVFGESQHVSQDWDGALTYNPLPEKAISAFDDAISKTKEFFQRINTGGVKKLTMLTFRYGQFAIFSDIEKDELIFVNSDEYIVPIVNLLANLMEHAASSDDDEVHFFYDEAQEIVHMSWYEGETGKEYFVAAINPCAITEKHFRKQFEENLQNLFGLSIHKFKKFKVTHLKSKEQ